MSMQQVLQPRPSSNGCDCRRVDRDMGTRLDNELPPAKPNLGSLSNTDAGSFGSSKSGVYRFPSHDRLSYVTTCLIGHPVEVQVKNGSIYSGIFHATDKDYAVVLKMARLIKEGSFKLHTSQPVFFIEGVSKTMIIPAKLLVQVIAKGVAVTQNQELTVIRNVEVAVTKNEEVSVTKNEEVAVSENQINDTQLEQSPEIMTDSSISQSSFVKVERELSPWVPDKDDPHYPELENIFDGTANRHWDQFETNATLFGVKSTFDEELYTTKLEKGPQMRARKRDALRIAKEIVSEETRDLHMEEERGISTNGEFDLDEETKYSSVYRGISDSEYKENEDTGLDSHKTETFGGSLDSLIGKSSSDASRRKTDNETHASSSFSSLDGAQLSQANAGSDLHQCGSSEYARQFDGQSRIRENQLRAHDIKNSTVESTEKRKLTDIGDNAQTKELTEGIQSPLGTEKMNSDEGGLSSNAAADPSVCSKDRVQPDSLGESSEISGSGRMHTVTQPGSLRGCPDSSASSSSEDAAAAAASASSGPGLSPSSSMGSLASEKSTLNPYAKEFNLNPNAKSFSPSHGPLRPTSPISDGSYYLPANASSIPYLHAVPMGFGIGPTFGAPQPYAYNPQGPPIPITQAYIHPNGPLFGQQSILGHPGQVMYMPSYPPDMQYRGGDF